MKPDASDATGAVLRVERELEALVAGLDDVAVPQQPRLAADRLAVDARERRPSTCVT